MNKSTKGALAVAAAGVLLLGGAVTLGFWASAEPTSGVIVAIGVVGYSAAIFVAAFGKHRPRHARS